MSVTWLCFKHSFDSVQFVKIDKQTALQCPLIISDFWLVFSVKFMEDIHSCGFWVAYSCCFFGEGGFSKGLIAYLGLLSTLFLIIKVSTSSYLCQQSTQVLRSSACISVSGGTLCLCLRL